MMREVSQKFADWSPATFIGYNSFRFDEPMLQRALWQALLPPFPTVMNASWRFDLLPVMRLVSQLAPRTFNWPRRSDGTLSFRLDALSQHNGFDASKAHDAEADVAALLFLSQGVEQALPNLWKLLVERSRRSESTKFLARQEVTLFVDSSMRGPYRWYGLPLQPRADQRSFSLVLNLSLDWQTLAAGGKDALTRAMRMSPRPVRQISFNKVPPMLSIREAQEHFNVAPDQEQLRQAEFVQNNDVLRQQLDQLAQPGSQAFSTRELEQRFLESFPSTEDQRLMAEFHQVDWDARSSILRQFSDPRLRQLAQRLIYVESPTNLPKEDVARMESAIRERIEGASTTNPPWRTIEAALAELDSDEDFGMGGEESVGMLRSWLQGLGR